MKSFLFLLPSGDLPIVSAKLGMILIGLYVIYSLSFSKKPAPSLVYFFLGLVPLIILHFVNRQAKYYAYHGLFYAGIVYEILEGHIPPANPFLSGTGIFYPWGYHLLSAFFVKALLITPVWAFVLINLISLGVCLCMFYKASQVIVSNARANAFQVLFSLFGATLPNMWIIKTFYYLHAGFDSQHLNRTNPTFRKFLGVNANSLGLAFFSIFLYALLKATQERKIGKYLALLFTSLVGAGFLYPPLLPAFIIALVGWAGIKVYYERKPQSHSGPAPFTIILTVILMIVSALLLVFPYLASISQEILKHAALFSGAGMHWKLFSYLFSCIPMLILFMVNRRAIVNAQNRPVVAVLWVQFILYSFLYFAVTFPNFNEYKFLILAQITIAFLGGASFGLAGSIPRKLIMTALACVFILPFYHDFAQKLSFMNDKRAALIEESIYIYPADPNERETYEWIKSHTPKKSVWLDKTAMMPVYAQRALWVAPPDESIGFRFRTIESEAFAPESKKYRAREPYEAIGFRFRTMELVAFAPGSKERREKIPLILSKDLKDDHPKDLYILDRRYDPFPQIGAFYNRLFTSNDGTYTIYSKNKG